MPDWFKRKKSIPNKEDEHLAELARLVEFGDPTDPEVLQRIADLLQKEDPDVRARKT